MIKKILHSNVFKITMMCIIMFSLLAFSHSRFDKRKASEIEVEFVKHDFRLLPPDSVNNLLKEKLKSTKNLGDIPLVLRDWENYISNHPLIEKSEVYLSMDGKLRVVVEQKQAMARVIDGLQEWYIDQNGCRMPLSAFYAVRVPIVQGNTEWLSQESYVKLMQVINNDPFLEQHITGIEVFPKGQLRLYNRGYAFVIDFGKPIHIEQKFRNYKAFLQKAQKDSLIHQYQKIDLKFTQQVVCTK